MFGWEKNDGNEGKTTAILQIKEMLKQRFTPCFQHESLTEEYKIK